MAYQQYFKHHAAHIVQQGAVRRRHTLSKVFSKAPAGADMNQGTNQRRLAIN